MTTDEITRRFTHAGGFHFARWVRPIVPMIYGVDDASMAVLRGGVELIARLTGHPTAEPGIANHTHITFLVRDWAEFAAVPAEDGLDTAALARTLADRDAQDYRQFRFDPATGGIASCVQAFRLTPAMERAPADLLGLAMAVAAHLHWAPGALSAGITEPGDGGRSQLRADLLRLMRAAYDPVLPAATRDPDFALRLAARIAVA